MPEDYWDGALWIYQGDVTNGAGGAGNQSYTLTIDTGNEAEILYGSVFQGDPTVRTASVGIFDGTFRIGRLLSTSLNQNAVQGYPSAATSGANGNPSAAGPRYIIGGGMRILATIESVALSEDTAYSIAMRIRGGVPTVVEAGQATPTIDVNREQVV